ncbi:MAG: hypothetical protein JWQ54_3182 [Mucilaginibacter sp.]|nr:hypothetical protein [Mucilaginibacter sp.]
MSPLRTFWLMIFYRGDHKEGTEIAGTKYYFECFF